MMGAIPPKKLAVDIEKSEDDPASSLAAWRYISGG